MTKPTVVLPAVAFSDSINAPSSAYPPSTPEQLPNKTIRHYESGSEPAEFAYNTAQLWLAKLGNGLMERLLNAEEYALPPPSQWDPNYRNVRELYGATSKTSSFALPRLPAGYRLYLAVTDYTSGGSANRRDWYLYGYTLDRVRYRSPNEFLDHLVWLITDPHHNFSRCRCKYCPARFKEKLLTPTFSSWPTFRVGEIVWAQVRVSLVKLRTSQQWTWKVSAAAESHSAGAQMASIAVTATAGEAETAPSLNSSQSELQQQSQHRQHHQRTTSTSTINSHRDIVMWPALVQECYARFDLNPEYVPESGSESEQQQHQQNRWIVRYQDKFKLLGVQSSADMAEYAHQRVTEMTEDQLLPYLLMDEPAIGIDLDAVSSLPLPSSQSSSDAEPAKFAAAIAALKAYRKASLETKKLRHLFWVNETAMNDPLAEMQMRSFNFSTVKFNGSRKVKGVQLGCEYIGLGDMVRMGGHADAGNCILEVIAIDVSAPDSVTFYGITYVTCSQVSDDGSLVITLEKHAVPGMETHTVTTKPAGEPLAISSVSISKVLGRFYSDYPFIAQAMNQPDFKFATDAGKTALDTNKVDSVSEAKFDEKTAGADSLEKVSSVMDSDTANVDSAKASVSPSDKTSDGESAIPIGSTKSTCEDSVKPTVTKDVAVSSETEATGTESAEQVCDVGPTEDIELPSDSGKENIGVKRLSDDSDDLTAAKRCKLNSADDDVSADKRSPTAATIEDEENVTKVREIPDLSNTVDLNGSDEKNSEANISDDSNFMRYINDS